MHDMELNVNINVFQQLLLSENQKQNLVSRKTVSEEIDKHIEDSLALLRFVNIESQSLIDIGSGAGFPGLILALHHTESQVTLMESDFKKAAFLQMAVDQLNLRNVMVLRERAENIGHVNTYRNNFSLCTSRAVASTRIMLEYGLPLLKIGGAMYLWKGPKYYEELTEAEDALKTLGGQFEDCYRYVLSDGNSRFLIKIKKIAVTPDKYPRRVGMPSKRPL